jgi:hypothetical protein
VSEQDQREDQPTDEEVQDLDVSEEQTDDVVGGKKGAERWSPDARK